MSCRWKRFAPSWALEFVVLFLCLVSARTRADDVHGPNASSAAFPSHVFQLAPRKPGAQLGFSYGLVQPILLHGFNAAVDLRIGRWIVTYSHGQGLHPARAPGTLTAEEKAAGLQLFEPYSTGGGVGVTLVDELYLLADIKLHALQVELDGQRADYKTVTVGGELGYRFFLWKGLYLSPVLRYWPNVWSSAGASLTMKRADGSTLVHKPVWQGIQGTGFFVNLLLGWAFDLGDRAGSSDR
jgi:hypothetical protein